MPYLKSLSSAAKIQLLQAFLCLILAIMVAGAYLFGLQQTSILEREAELVDRQNRIASLVVGVKDVQIAVIQVQQWLTDISATRGLDGLNDGFDKASMNADAFRKVAMRLVEDSTALGLSDIAKVLTEAIDHFEPYYATGLQMAERYVSEGPSGGNRLMADFDSVAARITGDLDKLIGLALTHSQSAQSEALDLQTDTSSFRFTLLLLGVVALGVGVGSIFITRRLDAQAQTEKHRSEALEAESKRMEQAEQARLREMEAVRQQEAAEKARIASLIIGELGGGLANLAKGNLQYRISSIFPQDFDHLRQAFNRSAEALASTLLHVKAGAAGIRSGSGEIAVASDDLARRTETQAASLEETAAAMSQIAAMLRKTADGAAKTREVVLAAKSDADDGGEVVGRAVAAMTNIEKSSNQIHQIIGVIDEIAFQTNLLALNAGVEAARAGETGRGFAVVASEVRALAQRSADAAKEIKQLLTMSRGQVEHGVALVSETGIALGRIVERIATIASAITEIASNVEQQSAGLREVNIAIDSLDQVTQQNAAMVEQANAATRSLSDQSMSLTELVGRFATEPVSDAA
ncbi:MAG: methyl-accepting chemotaxis protein [Alphaproteobacteria bacterium]|nr:methyl-accepting chemotaxis protein [Alphaproteobacteria bacterium]